jgi:hypothetical protein
MIGFLVVNSDDKGGYVQEMTHKLLAIPALIIALLGLLSCNGAEETTIRPVEQEQIENVVKTFLVRDTTIPEYEVTIEAVVDDWARVSVNPAGTETEQPTFLYLKKEVDAPANPTPTLTVQPGHESEVDTTTGWSIVLGPQASFTQAELDEVGVPPEIRP